MKLMEANRIKELIILVSESGKDIFEYDMKLFGDMGVRYRVISTELRLALVPELNIYNWFFVLDKNRNQIIYLENVLQLNNPEYKELKKFIIYNLDMFVR